MLLIMLWKFDSEVYEWSKCAIQTLLIFSLKLVKFRDVSVKRMKQNGGAVIPSDITQRNFSERRWIGYVLEGSTGGMGCLHNEVRRALFLTKEAKGVHVGFKLCQERRWRCVDLCHVRSLCTSSGQIQLRGGGGEATEEQQFEEQKQLFPVGCFSPAASNWNNPPTTRHLQSLHQISCLYMHKMGVKQLNLCNNISWRSSWLVFFSLHYLYWVFITNWRVLNKTSIYLGGFVIDTGSRSALSLFWPLSLEIRRDDCVQRKSSTNRWSRWPRSVFFNFWKQKKKIHIKLISNQV